jgi:hypothetical protein
VIGKIVFTHSASFAQEVESIGGRMREPFAQSIVPSRILM